MYHFLSRSKPFFQHSFINSSVSFIQFGWALHGSRDDTTPLVSTLTSTLSWRDTTLPSEDPDKDDGEDNMISDISHRREGCKTRSYPGARVTVFCAHGIPCRTADFDVLKCRCDNRGPSGQDPVVCPLHDSLH